jgi:DNA excision repair protein ERCC-2
VRNFGSILIEYSKIVPDGVVAFFPSYLYMESIVAAWNDMGILNEVWKHKLIFVETPDANETSIALENYRRVRVDHMWRAQLIRVSNPLSGV